MCITDGDPMRAALYVRVSTEDQAAEGFSLDAQTKRLKAYCNVRGWEVAEVYRDEGASGRTADRPEYRRMIGEADRWDIILVLKMDRIHRNSLNFTLMMDDLRGMGKEFTSVQDKFDTTTAMGRFVMDIMQRIAQLESEQTGERVKAGMARKAANGRGHLGSGHPFGYEYSEGELLVIDSEAETVREIYGMYRDGLSLASIADDLNSRLVPAKRSGRWNKQSVSNILRNPLYTGHIRWDGIVRRGEHEPILDLESYEAVNGPLQV